MTEERMSNSSLAARNESLAVQRLRQFGSLSYAAGLLALAGCAVFHQEAVDRHQDGWKAGTVKRIATAEQLGDRLKHDCRGESTIASDTFALVSYPHGKTWHSAIAPVAASSPVSVGQEVWVPTRNCQPVEPR